MKHLTFGFGQGRNGDQQCHPEDPRRKLFIAPRRKLIIELGGSQHLEQEEYDEERTNYFRSQGYQVIRFWNHDVMNNLENVLPAITQTLEEKHGEDER